MDIKLPKLTPDMTMGIISDIFVKVGDAVKQSAVIAKVDVDGLDYDLVAAAGGVVSSISVKLGDNVLVGAKIISFKSEDNSLFIPVDEEMHSQYDIPEVKSSASNSTKTITSQSQLQDLLGIKELDFQGFGFKKADIEDNSCTESSNVKISPLAKKIARENNVDISLIHGSGPEGKVMEQDVKNFLMSAAQSTAVSALPAMNDNAKNAALVLPFVIKLQVCADKLIEFHKAIVEESQFVTNLDYIVLANVLYALNQSGIIDFDNNMAVKTEFYSHSGKVLSFLKSLSSLTIKEVTATVNAGQSAKSKPTVGISFYSFIDTPVIEFVPPFTAESKLSFSVSSIFSDTLLNNNSLTRVNKFNMLISCNPKEFEISRILEFVSSLNNIFNAPDMIDVE